MASPAGATGGGGRIGARRLRGGSPSGKAAGCAGGGRAARSAMAGAGACCSAAGVPAGASGWCSNSGSASAAITATVPGSARVHSIREMVIELAEFSEAA